MKYLKEKKEFEKKFVFRDREGILHILSCIVDGETVWSWITSQFQSHDRKMLEWVLKEVVGEDGVGWRDKFGYYNLTSETQQIENKLRTKQRQLINQKIMEVEK